MGCWVLYKGLIWCHVKLCFVLQGLKLLLFLEESERVKGLRGGRGAKVVVHAHNTMSFVSQNGLSASAGEETLIGIKMVWQLSSFVLPLFNWIPDLSIWCSLSLQLNMTRLGAPYTICGDNGKFRDFYNNTLNYTIEVGHNNPLATILSWS